MAARRLPDNLQAFSRHPDVATQLQDPRSESSVLFAQLMGGLVASEIDGGAIMKAVVQNDDLQILGLLPHLRSDLVKTEVELQTDGWAV